jgi:type II secretory pathway predicted ATPase ExeA
LDLTAPPPLYEEFYGLVEPPFSLNPDPRFYFESRAHRAALDLVLGTFGELESAVIIAGDIGAGKTLLCSVALERIPPRTFLAVVPSLLVDRAAFFAQVLEQFGILSADWQTFPAPSADELVATLKQFLSTLPLLQAHAVIMVDDAQQIRPELLDEIRLLTNTGAESSRRLRVVLLGEPALLELLVGSSQPLLARTSDARVLSPLAAEEIEPYIRRRLWIARGSPIPDTPGPGGVSFARDSAAAVGACSGGLPATINALCHHALENAAARGMHLVDRQAVVAAAQQLGMPVPIATRLRPYRNVAIAAVVVLAAALSWTMTGGTFRGPRANGPGGPETRGSGEEVRQGARKDATPASTAPAAAASASTAPTPAEAPVVNATLQKSESFTVLVASFRTMSRAQVAADAVTALGLPGFMRTIQDGWQSVVVGPYASRPEAEEARNSLDLAHFAGSRVLSTPSTDPDPGTSSSSAILLAALLPVSGRSTIVIDLAAEPGGATLRTTDNRRSTDVEIGPLPGRIDDQNLVPAGPGILERIAVRSVVQGETSRSSRLPPLRTRHLNRPPRPVRLANDSGTTGWFRLGPCAGDEL